MKQKIKWQKIILIIENAKKKLLLNRDKKVFLVLPKTVPKDKRQEVFKRAKYFLPEFEITLKESITDNPGHPTIATQEFFDKIKNNNQFFIYNIDYESNPMSGINWHHILESSNPQHDNEISQGKIFFQQFIKKKKINKYSKTYLFGTGPSLEKHINRSYSDGYRVVCNTFAKDNEAWNQINPHFIVAADCYFHFGVSEYAKKFRSDLYLRMKEHDDFLFIYPSIFHEFIKRKYLEFSNRLIPIPLDSKLKSINNKIFQNYKLPLVGNILNMMMLPIGTSLTKKIVFVGFDGRKKNDKYFWKHSQRHNYSDLIGTVEKANPAFFKEYIPKKRPNSYQEKFLNTTLENNLAKLETKGYHFKAVHTSTILPLKKRYQKG